MAIPGRRWRLILNHLNPCLALHRRDTEAGLPEAPWPPQYPKVEGEPPRVAPSRAKKT